MFTGIVEEIGTVLAVKKGAKSTQLTIAATKITEDLKHGDSVCTDGVCLTVSRLDKRSFTADVMAQTMAHSSLGKLQIGMQVNLERALQLATRMGGHIVSGHIDCTGTIVSITQEDIARWVEISVPAEQMRYIVERGSICVDGISLTVAKVKEQSFSVSTIPVTQQDTTLSSKKQGASVNIETDMLAKYTEKLLQLQPKEVPKSKLSMEFLQEKGFL